MAPDNILDGGKKRRSTKKSTGTKKKSTVTKRKPAKRTGKKKSAK